MSKVKCLYFLTLFISSTAFAKFDTFLTQKMELPESVKETSNITTFSNKAVSNLSPADNQKTLVAKIVDNSINYWWDNSGIKNTKIGQAVETVQNKVRADVNLGSTGSDKSANVTNHKLSVRLLAAQSLAKVEYFGWFKAAFTYNAKTSTAETELYENLANNKALVVSHTVSALERRSQVSFRWNW